MPLAPGTRLGPYELQTSLGAGGMGEVHRARDIRLGRDVAVKVLPENFARTPDRLERFEYEARLLSTVSHPNILAIHDVGADRGVHYLVSELLEGQTLREKMADGPIPQRRATEYALEIARGLAAAHEKGVVHRDLKPDNIFVTKDNRVKILDFGLAKQSMIDGDSHHTATMSGPTPTQPGTVMGTVGYMSPEQVRGQAVDHRTDLFSLGAILYEMVSGKRAFKGESGVETMNAILKEDPPEFSDSGLAVMPGLERVIRHCLEKEPAMRFQSARDLCFDLENLSNLSSGSKITAGAATPARSRWRTPLLVVVPTLLAAALAFWIATTVNRPATPLFTRVTFRGGHISSARFSHDGRTIVYSAAFGDEPLQVYSTVPDAPQSRELGMKNSSVLAISSKDELALTLNHTQPAANVGWGTLARVPLTGGSPRELNEAVTSADWSPDGQSMALADVKESSTLEYPRGTKIYETQGWIDSVRISRDGEMVAFVEHPIRWDTLGMISIVDRQGKHRTLTGSFSDIRGLAWSPSGKEIWFTANHVHLSSNLFAVDMDGRQRLVWANAGAVLLQDVSADGRVLFIRENRRRGIAGLFPGHTTETDLSWQDWTLLTQISSDGKWIFFSEEGDGGGQKYSAYMRATDGSPAIRLGDGTPYGVSPDMKWVAAIVPGRPQQLLIHPTRAGESRNLSQAGFDYDFVKWLPNAKQLFIVGREPGKRTRCYVAAVDTGELTAITPEGVQGLPTADGKEVVAQNGEVLTFYPINRGQPRTQPAKVPALIMPQGGITGRTIVAAEQEGVPLKLFRYDIVTGEKKPWRELIPADRAGVYILNLFDVTPDERWYAYSYVRDLSDVYMVEGLK